MNHGLRCVLSMIVDAPIAPIANAVRMEGAQMRVQEEVEVHAGRERRSLLKTY
jgi:hypothetical protein